MKRFLAVLTALSALLVLPSGASAKIIEIGRPSGDTMPAPACPKRPCLAISRTTAYQAKVGPRRGLFTVPADGRIVAWTVTLAKPGPKQIDFFDKALGGESEAQLTVLRTGKRLYGRVVAQSPTIKLRKYFGHTVQFPLERTIRVRKGSLVAITVPTWAPILAPNLESTTSWRSAGKGQQCDPTRRRTAQTELRQLAQYRCLYKNERLTYSATLVTDPDDQVKKSSRR